MNLSYSHYSLLLVWAFVQLSILLSAQEFSYPISHYSVKDGLPQAQVTGAFMDQDGFLWLSTHSGMALFDGRHFHTSSFTPLDQEYISNFVKGRKDIYLNTLNNEVIRYNGKVHYLVEGTPNPDKPMSVFFVDPRDRLFLIDWKSSTHQTESSNLYITISDTICPIADVYPELQTFVVAYGWGDPDWSYNTFLDHHNRFIIHDPATHKVIIDSTTLKGYGIFIPWMQTYHKQEQSVSIACTKKGKLSCIFNFDGDQLVKTVAFNESTGRYYPTHALAPLCFEPKVAHSEFFYLKEDSVYVKVQYPATGHIRRVFGYNDQVILTSDDGIFIMHVRGLKKAELADCKYPWTVIPAKEDTYIVSCYEEGVIRINKEAEIQEKTPFIHPFFRSDSSLRSQLLTNYIKLDGKILFGSIKGFGKYEPGKDYIEFTEIYNAVESFAFDPEKNAAIIGSRKLYWLDTATLQFIDSLPVPEEVIGKSEPTDLQCMPNGNLWISGRSGLARLDKTLNFELFTKDNGRFPSNAAICMEADHHGRLWIGTSDGVYHWNDSAFIAYRPEAVNGRINQLKLTDKDELIAVSGNKITVGKINSKAQNILAVFNVRNGYSPTEPSENGMNIDAERTAWIPIVDGILKLPLNKALKNLKEGKVRMLSINNESCLFEKDQKKFIQGSFARIELGISDPNAESWQHQYRLNNGKLSPPISSPSFLISNFEHGNNNLQVLSHTLENPDRKIENSLVINAHLPFWDRSTIQGMAIGIILLFMGLIFFSFYQNYRKQRQLSGLRGQLKLNRLQTIQAYLNPHFIFNTLTTIQDSILNQDKEKGNDMVMRLSRIFRYVLNYDYSEASSTINPLTTVRLKDELKLIGDFVFLHQNQYERSIKYIEDIEGELESEDIRIPALLIQPFVENAYKHAFPKTVKNATIILKIRRENGVLHIQIKDNGIGYSTQQSSSQRNSWGKKLATERMALLNELGVKNDIQIKHRPEGSTIDIKINMNYESLNR